MEPNASFSAHNRRKPSYTDRYNSLFSHSVTSTTTVNSDDRDELNEEDVFWIGDDVSESDKHHHHHKTSESNPPSTSSTSPSSSSSSLDHHRTKGFYPTEAFGILAVLPENKNGRISRSIFNHKASTSPSSTTSSSSSSARMIPVLPRPPTVDRHVKYHQSAPVNVPIGNINSIGKRRQRSLFANDDDGDYGDGEEGQMLPPHEIVSRRLANSPIVSCSVLEGTGRTLKGRDLRRVRNAVFQQTGFID